MGRTRITLTVLATLHFPWHGIKKVMKRSLVKYVVPLSYLPLLFPCMCNPTLVYIEKIEETRGTFHGVAL